MVTLQVGQVPVPLAIPEVKGLGSPFKGSPVALEFVPLRK